MTFAATLSISMAVLAAFLAFFAARISSGPGWRELAPFSIGAAFAAVFAACDAVFTLPVSDTTIVGASRLGTTAAGLYGSVWYFYYAAQQKRGLTRFERGMVGVGIVCAFAALIPDLLITHKLYSRPCWGIVYRDAYPTVLGEIVFGIYCLAILELARRYFVLWRRGTPGALAHFIGLVALVLAGVNDSLTSAYVYEGPYLLDVGFLVVVGCVGSTLTVRFLDAAHSLERQTAKLRATQAELVKQERLAALGELSAVVAHEVRTPVSIMFNALSVLRRQRMHSETEALIGIVEEEAQRLKRMIDDLLAFARPQTLRMTRVEVHPMIDGAVEAARAVTQSNVEVVIQVDEDVPNVTCDEHRIREAVINLVTNAIQASRRVEPVRVHVTREGPRVHIAVIDDGVGVPRELVPRLFTPFFTTRPTGTGLGLAVVRRIAEGHGGEALCHAQGPGATFVLVLPIESALRPSTTKMKTWSDRDRMS